MQLRNSPTRYGAVVIALHWLTAVLVGLAWLLGTFHDDLPRGAARSAGLFIHTSAGLAILGLVALRVPWRLFDRPLPLEATRLGVWLGLAASLTHMALYALLIATPAVGIVLQFALGRPLPILGSSKSRRPGSGTAALPFKSKTSTRPSPTC